MLNPEEWVTVEQALKAVTLHAAWLDFEEDIKGSIESGKLADFTLLKEDLFQVDPKDIIDIEVAGTVLGGRFMPPVKATT